MNSPAPSNPRRPRFRLPGFSATAVANLALALAVATAALAPFGVFSPNSTDPPLALRPKLRVITWAEPIAFLPRSEDPIALDRAMAADLAEALDRDLELVPVDDVADLFPALMEGRGDLVAASLRLSPEQQAKIATSVPYLYTDDVVLVRRGGKALRQTSDLAGTIVSVRPETHEAATLERIRGQHPGVVVEELSRSTSLETIVDRLSRGTLQATILDSHLWEALAPHFPEVHAPLAVTRNRPVVLTMRKDDSQLRTAVNEFLFRRAFEGTRSPDFTGDWEEIAERGTIRMITRNDPACYYIHRGNEFGFEFELLRKFAEAHGLRVEVVIPERTTDLVPKLLQGGGDVLAAAWPIAASVPAGAVSTRANRKARQVIVVRDEDHEVNSPEQLASRTVGALPGSTHFEELKSLQETYPALRIANVPETFSEEDLLACVDDGQWDAALCNSESFEIERMAGLRLRIAFDLGQEDLGWLVRAENSELLRRINEFLSREQKRESLVLLRRRSFHSPEHAKRMKGAFRSEETGRISPYDDLIKQAASRHNLDWRLVVALMQEESGFDNEDESGVGAVGVMQLMPATAASLGVEDPRDPRQSIEGGVKYIRQLLDETDAKLPLATRVRFALACYNVGRAHLLDAKRLATRLGLRSDRWYGNVEKAILLLERDEYARQARYGYCRGSECADFVRDVEARYQVFMRHLPGTKWHAVPRPAPPASGSDGANEGKKVGAEATGR